MKCNDRIVGFNSWCLGQSDVDRSLEQALNLGVDCIEFSLTGFGDLGNHIDKLLSLDLSAFQYVSAHAPRFETAQAEIEGLRVISQLVDAGWGIVIHPDCVFDMGSWSRLGPQILVETLVGSFRTSYEIHDFLAKSPGVNICIDVAHLLYLDPTGELLVDICNNHYKKIKEVHISSIVGSGEHFPMNSFEQEIFLSIKDQIPLEVPFIIEAESSSDDWMSAELEKIRKIVR